MQVTESFDIKDALHNQYHSLPENSGSNRKTYLMLEKGTTKIGVEMLKKAPEKVPEGWHAPLSKQIAEVEVTPSNDSVEKAVGSWFKSREIA